MKSWRKLLAVLLAMAVALSCVPGCGLEVKAAVSGDFKYEVNEDGNSVEITGYAGSGGDIVIPAEIDGKEVTSIRWAAFYGCSGITGMMVIPDSVTSIGYYALGYFGWYEPIPDFFIYGTSGSEAERYAKGYGLAFLLSSGRDPSQSDSDKNDISSAGIILEKTSYPYDGNPKTPISNRDIRWESIGFQHGLHSCLQKQYGCRNRYDNCHRTRQLYGKQDSQFYDSKSGRTAGYIHYLQENLV